MLFSPGPRYSFTHALGYITLSVLIFVPTARWLLFPDVSCISEGKPVPIKNIFLMPMSQNKLQGTIFSELLELYADSPSYLNQFSTKQAEILLEKQKVFSHIAIKKVPDNKGIVISYALHTPIAYLANKTNTLIDQSGNFFPCQPFFRPLKLPRIFFAKQDLEYPVLPSWKMDIISILLRELMNDVPTSIDVSSTDNYPGEVVITLHSGTLLRLRRNSLEKAIKCYHIARERQLIKQDKQYLVDLRFPNYLLVKEL
ncbi:cell division protein FtsQ/DivIB [Chlamydia ibidis]|nr:hypothetical protein [Chlamydia ibidis]